MEEQIKNSLISTLTVEANSISNIANQINDKVVEAVKIIYNCKGKLVLTGIGKSALIAQKIVATLNSTGSKSIFMHAADAVHGDLGLLNKEDIVICISKSGDTAELKALLPIVRYMGNTIVGMVSNPNSFLANQCDYTIFLPIDKEADPNNLAPTASTTAQLAMGDAIAVALLELRGFTNKDFAQLHPGGSLGKFLYTTISDLSYYNLSPNVFENDNLATIITNITSGRLGATVVLNIEKEIKGIITDGDLRRMLQKGGINDSICAKDIMTANPKCAEGSLLAVQAMQLMKENKINHVIVTKDSNYVGIVHIQDLVREGIF